MVGLTATVVAVVAQDTDQMVPEPIPAVRVLIAEPAPTVQARRFFGRVRARETVDLSFEVGGYMQVLNATEGQRVAEGSLLAALDAAPFERAVERAELALLQAEREFQRARVLAARDAVSEVRAEDAETARDLAAIALREAQDDLTDASVTAPFNGLVATRLSANFTNVSPGEPILRLHDMSQVRVEFDLPERLLPQVGDPASVVFSTELPDSDGPVSLTFVEFHAETDRIGQSYTVTLAFSGIDSAFLVPGASVTVTAQVPAEGRGIVLPASAIVAGPDRSAAVMVVEGSGDGPATVRRHPVDVRSETGTGFRIRGLPAGAEVVSVGGHLLRDGQVVRRYVGLTVEEP